MGGSLRPGKAASALCSADQQIVGGALRRRKLGWEPNRVRRPPAGIREVENQVVRGNGRLVGVREPGSVDLHRAPGGEKAGQQTTVLQPGGERVGPLGGYFRNQPIVVVCDRTPECVRVLLLELAEPLPVKIARVAGAAFGEGALEALARPGAEVGCVQGCGQGRMEGADTIRAGPLAVKRGWGGHGS